MTKQDYSNQWLKDLKLSRPLIITGPCSAETEEQMLETAKNLKNKEIIMTFVDIIDDNNLIEDTTKDMLVELLKCAAKHENINTEITEMSLSFVSKEEIQEINRDYRGKDVPTDVISFALNDEIEDEVHIIGLEDEFNSIGDIIICVDIAREQAQEYNHSFDREIGFLAVHGFLHLLGYDHMNEEDEKVMFTLQRELLDKYDIKR